MPNFSGHWFTTFGPMELIQERDRVRGTYLFQQTSCTIEGSIREGKLHFSYHEPAVEGEGWFELGVTADSKASGGRKGTSAWSSCDRATRIRRVWETSFGLLRLAQEPDRIIGFYEGAGPCCLEGPLKQNRVAFSYREPRSQGEGYFDLAPDATSFSGEWRAVGAQRGLPGRDVVL